MMETLKLPNEVVDADWQDDIDYETFGTDKQEMEYVAPEDVSKASIEKLKSIDLRQRFQDRGKKVGKLFSLEGM